MSTTPISPYCEFADVSFPSLPESLYRVHVKANAAQTRAEIWLESKNAKLQWQCTVEDFDKHIASRYALPAAVVLTSIKVHVLFHSS
ncbi:hypothetical protein SDRG_14083 [Saprolegnia diclina VS20]|uniref:Uncharacterized protein n=1 Tax=Saprolegnia diclina (strain VS20) TaxID=1156394 RepID=T0R7Q4_SAPDV|nr:hypothetical protein SDRG_14083 [Saprolegnia diclina VS20]EQC28123.1 hypothetical protein SDRG_14083 [Saprolegnia diclina VS20]|eukprot:XP_008618409.1 hypothetical protein SDRG_14083 [Saprolegnia diclina VS20]